MSFPGTSCTLDTFPQPFVFLSGVKGGFVPGRDRIGEERNTLEGGRAERMVKSVPSILHSFVAPEYQRIPYFSFFFESIAKKEPIHRFSVANYWVIK